MAKSINVLLSLKDQFTAPMKKVGDTTKDTERKMTAMKVESTINSWVLLVVSLKWD